MIASVLVICEGNVCRSPMACALLAGLLPHTRVVSAGTHARVGEGASPLAIDVMAARGMDIRAHVATAVHENMVRHADLVMTMTTAQRRVIESRHAFARGRVYRLCRECDVIDPYRRDRTIFETSLQQIERGVAQWLDVLARAPC
jgi:protein-tyrosine phosphatase